MTGLPHLPAEPTEYERERFAERLAPMAAEAERIAREMADLEESRIALRLPALEPCDVRDGEECVYCGEPAVQGAAWIYRHRGPYCAPCACREHAGRAFV